MEPAAPGTWITASGVPRKSGLAIKTFLIIVTTCVDIPPGLKGTIIFIGFSGYFAKTEKDKNTTRDRAAAVINNDRFILILLYRVL